MQSWVKVLQSEDKAPRTEIVQWKKKGNIRQTRSSTRLHQIFVRGIGKGGSKEHKQVPMIHKRYPQLLLTKQGETIKCLKIVMTCHLYIIEILAFELCFGLYFA
jgi:hypothetical protein